MKTNKSCEPFFWVMTLKGQTWQSRVVLCHIFQPHLPVIPRARGKHEWRRNYPRPISDFCGEGLSSICLFSRACIAQVETPFSLIGRHSSLEVQLFYYFSLLNIVCYASTLHAHHSVPATIVRSKRVRHLVYSKMTWKVGDSYKMIGGRGVRLSLRP